MIFTIPSPESWSNRARCANAAAIMFGEDTDTAKSICDGCPVRRKCLAYALDLELDFGVWGATTFAERTKMCPICHGEKEPSALGCSGAHSLLRLARLVEQQNGGDPTVSVSTRSIVTAPTSPACVVPRGRSHSTAKAYRLGCRCQAARDALYRERESRAPRPKREVTTDRERFLSLIQVDDDGHWLWRGGLNGSGYGNFWLHGRTVRAHHFAFSEFVGPVPERTRLHPIEGEPRGCVNPEHFRAA